MKSRRANCPSTAHNVRKAIQLRNAGLTYAEIGHRLDLSTATAHRYVAEAVAAIPAEEATQLRQLEVERLDRLQRAVWTQALDGDLGAVREVVRIIDRRVRLLGLDAPAQVDVGIGTVDIAATATQILEELEGTINASGKEPTSDQARHGGASPHPYRKDLRRPRRL